jgi:hypothetical protein
MKPQIRRFCLLFAILISLIAMAPMARATTIQVVSGTSPAGNPFSFQANLTISGGTLTIQLFNNSANSLARADLLGSYFFDIINSMGLRPTLILTSATGTVYQGVKNQTDTLIALNTDLMAETDEMYTWQFESLNSLFRPFEGFGISAVGNNDLNQNSFNGNILDGTNGSIYAGDVTTSSLNGNYLVGSTATFTFSGVSGFTESDISSVAVFGLGTAPDGLASTAPPAVPEPSTIVLMLSGVALMAVYKIRR